MQQIPLTAIPSGAAVEVVEAELLTVRQNAPGHQYLCIDEEQRLITIKGGTHLLGSSNKAELIKSLASDGFKPFIQES